MPVEDPQEPGDHFEERLGAALFTASGAFETDRSALTAAGRARGRTLLRRRRAAVAAGVAAVAVVGVGGSLLVPTAGDAHGQATVAAQRTVPSPPSENDGDISAADLVRTLKGLLPAGEVRDEQGRGVKSPLMPYAQVVYDDGKGGGEVSVGLNRVAPGSERPSCPDRLQVPYDLCTTTELADGSTLMLYKGYEYPDRRKDTKLWQVDLVTAQGQHISAMEWNAEAEKGAPVTRPEPPLTLAQLQKIATAPAWRKAVDAIPRPPKPSRTPVAPPAEADGAAVRRTLISLVPKGIKVVEKGSPQDGFADLVLDDGKGRSLVQINVQSNMSDVEDELFGAGAETLPDGTKVVTHQGPGEKGGSGVVMWTVDTIRPDGRRVVISAFNSERQSSAATRATPALTIKQLKAIATSPLWNEFS
ncbi:MULTISPECIES: hypothetical protein [unclassified Streptomyces]|uniref:hypothetical protein n=1 Tax=unclassified Streptomyces TaxID=2593676 RepID=UPI003817795E